MSPEKIIAWSAVSIIVGVAALILLGVLLIFVDAIKIFLA